MDEAPIPDFTPVVVLTGFLGSGKTTLLTQILRDPALADTAVLINEFGEVGLDHHLLERVDETMVMLASGCLCCTIRGELSDAVKRLLSQRERGLVPPFRRVVIETSGLADPLPILSTLAADPVLKHHFRLGAVIATLDAVNGADQLSRQPESVKQMAAADRIVLTKTDLASPTLAQEALSAVAAINPEASVITVPDAALDVAALLAECGTLNGSPVGRMRCLPVDDAALEDGGTMRHTADVEAFSLVVDRPIDWTAFGLWLSMLLHRHGERILRVKGLLNVEGSATPVAIHGVQHLVHVPRHLAAWPDDDRRSRIVFIVRGLDPGLVRRSMRAFGLPAA